MGFKLLYSNFQVSEPQWKRSPGCPGKSAQGCWRRGARGLSVVQGGVSAHGSILSRVVLKVVGYFVCLHFGEQCSAFALLGHHWQCLSQQDSDTHHGGGDDDDLC